MMKNVARQECEDERSGCQKRNIENNINNNM